MPKLRINGLEVEVDKGASVLEAIRFLGFDVPTLCYNEGLRPYGACRLCVVEIGDPRNGSTKLVSSCTYPAEDGLIVRTHTERVVKARKVLAEMLVATCPGSKTIQDIAASLGVNNVRFDRKNEDCILCGLCTRMCEEQMMAKAIGFTDRGEDRAIKTPFDKRSDVCRLCGACMYICPACQARCMGPQEESVLCGACQNLEPSCLEAYDDVMCYMGHVEECGHCVKPLMEEHTKRGERFKEKMTTRR
jgi:bidirectional [NiFe] hydrogenase diaphorase subunit